MLFPLPAIVFSSFTCILSVTSQGHLKQLVSHADHFICSSPSRSHLFWLGVRLLLWEHTFLKSWGLAKALNHTQKTT